MESVLTIPRTRFLAGLFTNLAAGWFAMAFITPNFSDLSKINDIWILTYDLFFAIVFSWLAIKLEEKLEKTKI